MKCNLAVIKGDGIGPEIVTEAMKVLNTVGKIYGHEFDYEEILPPSSGVISCYSEETGWILLAKVEK